MHTSSICETVIRVWPWVSITNRGPTTTTICIKYQTMMSCAAHKYRAEFIEWYRALQDTIEPGCCMVALQTTESAGVELSRVRYVLKRPLRVCRRGNKMPVLCPFVVGREMLCCWSPPHTTQTHPPSSSRSFVVLGYLHPARHGELQLQGSVPAFISSRSGLYVAQEPDRLIYTGG